VIDGGRDQEARRGREREHPTAAKSRYAARRPAAAFSVVRPPRWTHEPRRELRFRLVSEIGAGGKIQRSHRNRTKPPGSTRVVRDAIQRYSDLDARAACEHDAWRDTRLGELELQMPRSSNGVRTRVLDELSAELLLVARTVGDAHGTPDLGNKPDPVDELVYIILSRRTREGAYQASYDALKARYATWEQLASASVDEIERSIGFSGLGRRKAHSLIQALGTLIVHFGSCTLEPTRSWSDDQTLDFLCTLPEVGPKSAACVMMCSLDRPAFPVDAHVGRVLERLGVFRVLGIELVGTDHKAKQRLLWNVVPPALRYPLHVNLLVHGRTTCLPRRPRCGSCVLRDACASPGAQGAPVSSRTTR
jgi:endonuclease III